MPNNMLAAIDLGSNSFHMMVARVVDGRLQVVDRLKERVRLAEGMDEFKNLSEEAMQRGLNCLAIFAERMQSIHPDAIRVTGTYTLRVAHNAQHFIERAKQLLGHPIEIISGLEEARLIYQGVSHTQHTQGRMLVIDIGGGSTELIIGEKYQPVALTSRKMGCVTFTKQFFSNGKLSEKNFNAAIFEALHQLEPILTQFTTLSWRQCLGSSGTIKTVKELLLAIGGDGQITLAGLEHLKTQMIQQKYTAELKLPELTDDRRPVIAAGVSILIALFQGLGIEQMDYSDGALREGILYEFASRQEQHDTREQTAKGLADMYHIDIPQAKRVKQTALFLFDSVSIDWQLAYEQMRPLLGWAAALHEVGLVINFSAIQRHSSYILQNSDLPGFNQEEQQALASLVRFHRKAIKAYEFSQIPNYDDQSIWRCVRLLRIAVALNHRRMDELLPHIGIRVIGDTMTLVLPHRWCENNRLLMQNLEREQKYMKAMFWELVLEVV
jgi:exopolyphosphatase / guanosine-5'-triphosphate,3'-diphosphate pyrophosphatase